jgi:hypothetical protein
MAMTRRHAGISRAAGGSIQHARKDAVRGRKENRSRKQNPECVHDFIIQEPPGCSYGASGAWSERTWDERLASLLRPFR